MECYAVMTHLLKVKPPTACNWSQIHDVFCEQIKLVTAQAKHKCTKSYAELSCLPAVDKNLLGEG